MAGFAGFAFSVEIVKNVTKVAKRGKTGQVDAVKSSKNVVEIGAFYYSGILEKILLVLFKFNLYLFVPTLLPIQFYC